MVKNYFEPLTVNKFFTFLFHFIKTNAECNMKM